MATTLIKGQAVETDLLALYAQEAGHLADPYKVELQVLNTSAGLPGVALLPVGGGWQNVTSHAVAHFATGCYAVVDPVTGQLWAPAATVAEGLVRWRVTATNGATPYYVERRFEVLDTNAGTRPSLGLTLLADLRAVGIPVAVTDRMLLSTALRWRDLIERMARQRFRPIRESRSVEGTGALALMLPEPLHALSAMYMNGNTVASSTPPEVYGHSGEGRRNPYLQNSAVDSDDLYARLCGSGEMFSRRLKQTVSGVWGWFESDSYEPPWEIREAAVLGVQIMYADRDGTLDPGVAIGGPLKRERTDRHEQEYAVTASAVRTNMLALLRDARIREAIQLYRGPLGMGTPG